VVEHCKPVCNVESSPEGRSVKIYPRTIGSYGRQGSLPMITAPLAQRSAQTDRYLGQYYRLLSVRVSNAFVTRNVTRSHSTILVFIADCGSVFSTFSTEPECRNSVGTGIAHRRARMNGPNSVCLYSRVNQSDRIHSNERGCGRVPSVVLMYLVMYIALDLSSGEFKACSNATSFSYRNGILPPPE